MVNIKTNGRKTIFANYSEKELLSGTIEDVKARVIDIMNNAIPIYKINQSETNYLWNYYKGKQDIYTDKQKLTRENINNMTVENWAYAFVDFKKTYLLGKPIQYVQRDSSSSEEITELNDYVEFENKKSKDMLLYEDILVGGRGFRYANKDEAQEEDDAPFEIINCDPMNTEVVYSSRLGHEQLLSFMETPMQDVIRKIDPETKEPYDDIVRYSEYTVYLRNVQMVLNDKSGVLEVSEETKPIILKEHVITEYYVNRGRLSLIELGKDLFNDINYLESLDKDDMEAYVNNLLVFINCEATEEDIKEMVEMGAVNITSTDQKKASIETIQQRLKADDTQTYYNRLVNALHQILGVPVASTNGNLEHGDTGKARLTGQGYTSATIRIEGDEAMFGDCDKNCLKTILKICHESPKSKINNLKLRDIMPKFQRDVSDNLLVKTQGLSTLLSCNIPKKYALSIVNLFSDVEAVVKDMEAEEKERENKNLKFQKNNDEQNYDGDDNIKNAENKFKPNAQNNMITKVENKQEQE